MDQLWQYVLLSVVLVAAFVGLVLGFLRRGGKAPTTQAPPRPPVTPPRDAHPGGDVLVEPEVLPEPELPEYEKPGTGDKRLSG